MTMTDLVKNDEEIGHGPDVKKQVVEEGNGVFKCDNQINPDAEKVVVRKLDWRIVTLLVVLCLFLSSLPSTQSPTKLTYWHPDLLATLDRSNIGYESCCEILRTGKRLLLTLLEMLVLQAWRRLLNSMVQIISGC